MSKIVSTIAGDFDKPRYDKLSRAYAKFNDREQFFFEGEWMLVSFAKYLLEYLEPHFKHIK